MSTLYHLATGPAGRRSSGPLAPFPALAIALAVAILAALAGPAPADGHQGNPDYRSVIDSVTPEVPGLEVEVIDYDADLRLTVPEGTGLQLPGYEGEPYARILPDGTVEVNERSPSAYLNTDRYGDVQVPAEADPGAEPRWETVRTDGVFQWHDHRSHWMSPEPPENVRGTTDRTVLFDYEIPFLVDDRSGGIEGTLYWVGPERGTPLPFIIAGLAVVAAGGSATLLLRRRRAARDEGSEAW